MNTPQERYSGLTRRAIAQPGVAPKSWEPKYTESRNKGHGFYGQVEVELKTQGVERLVEKIFGDVELPSSVMSVKKAAELIWDGKMHYLVVTGRISNEDEARDFLDSRMGRHYADIVFSDNPQPGATGKLIKEWRKTYDPKDYEGNIGGGF